MKYLPAGFLRLQLLDAGLKYPAETRQWSVQYPQQSIQWCLELAQQSGH